MKNHSREARDIPDAWFQLVDLCYQEGRDYVISKGSYQGTVRRELDFVTVRITHPCTQPRNTRIPTIPSHYGIPDPIPEGIDYVDQYLPYIMTDRVAKNEQYSYGSRLMGKLKVGRKTRFSQVDEVIRGYKLIIAESRAGDRLEINPRNPQETLRSNVVETCGVEGCSLPSSDEVVLTNFETSVVLCLKHDQIYKKIVASTDHSLRRNFATNQLTMTIAEPRDIYLEHPPCLREIGTRIYEPHYEDGKKLNFIIQFRSHDLWCGLPANFCALADLMDFMAGEIGVEPGEFIYTSQGLHLYDMYWNLAKTRLGLTKVDPMSRENIALTKLSQAEAEAFSQAGAVVLELTKERKYPKVPEKEDQCEKGD